MAFLSSGATAALEPGLAARIARYGLALVFCACALLVTWALQQFVQGRPTLFLFFAAVAASAWYGGRGPGIFAAVLASPAVLYFVTHSGAGPIDINLFAVVAFLGVCVLAGEAINSRERAAGESLVQAHRQLQLKAAELQTSNDALKAEMAERRRAEDALQETQAELARAGRISAMGELAASIAHEINQPLAAVVTNAGSCLRWLAGADPNIDEARHAAERVIRDGERAGEVVGRVRAMVRRASTERCMLQVHTVLDESLALLRHELQKNRVVLSAVFAPDVPAVLGDRIQLQQVVINIVMNAVEAMSALDGPRQLDVRSEKGEDGTIVIRIEDNGPGFAAPPESIFEAFVSTKDKGMGLGLSICRTIVEAHGGRLWAEAKSPRGASFHVMLPAASQEA